MQHNGLQSSERERCEKHPAELSCALARSGNVLKRVPVFVKIVWIDDIKQTKLNESEKLETWHSYANEVRFANLIFIEKINSKVRILFSTLTGRCATKT